ncbi:MAG: Arc/MetJ-type ribon-helix-helix transcriptional regulator, partial [Natronomonas sp.]
MDMPRIDVQLDEDVHSDWKEHVESGNRYNTLTQLIRYSVAEQIKRDKGEKGGAEDFDPEKIQRAVDESIDSLRTDMRSMRNDIVETQRVVESMTDEEYHLSNAMELHDLVPKVSSIEEAVEGSESGSVSDLEEDFRTKVSQDVSSSDIRIALARLENDVPQVKSAVIDGERVY